VPDRHPADAGPDAAVTALADDSAYAGLDLSDLVLDEPRAGGRTWRERRFVDCTLHDADLRGLVTERCTFETCRFRGTDLGDSAHRGSAFRSCTFERTTLSDARFSGCSLLGSTVLDSRLRPLVLTDCDLTLAALGGVDLQRTAPYRGPIRSAPSIRIVSPLR
jgi:uncharacterized protein YjbI with pentapeptide repeats